MLTLSQFDYHLPQSAIAQFPAEPRDSSKLLVLDRKKGAITHSHFYDLWKFLQPGDVLVRNNSKVIKARLKGTKKTGGSVEVLLNKETSRSRTSTTWECLTKPGLRVGQEVVFHQLHAMCIKDTGYSRLIEFYTPPETFFSQLDTLGEVPLPPYISQMSSPVLAKQYQTLYAQYEGSVAAPTAGLHFTPQLDAQLQKVGVTICEVTLHVGLGTFLPVKSELIQKHTMHEEVYSISQQTADIISAAKSAGKRVIAVGTTTTRVLETVVDRSKSNSLVSGSGSTSIFIYPPKQFFCIDGLITNFHLPKSTLLMLISAFTSYPNTVHQFTSFKESVVGKAYREALEHQYRFFSFGDGMLII